MTRRLMFAAILPGLIALGLFGLPAVATAQDSALQVSEDFEGLYRRALSRPGARLLDAPDGAELRQLPPFQIYYIYQQDADWTKVGTAVADAPAGYIATSEVLDWNTNIVATFNNRAAADRDRHMIFESRDKIVELLRQENVAGTSAVYRERAIAGSPMDGSGVIAMEPDAFVDLRDRFYILPILQAERGIRLPGRNKGNILQIAAMSANKEPAFQQATAPDLSQMPIDIVFVIDTTRSMQPYIDETREAAQRFANDVAGTEASERMRFGIVEFRDNVALAPDLEYATRIALPLADTSDADAFVAAINEVNATQANSDGFNEDAMAGLHTAITELDWSEAGAKMIYLITDAGPRLEGTTVPNLQLPEIRGLAEEKGIIISTWHLLTPGGTFDHDAASGDYRSLSQFGSQSTYEGIAQGEPEAFQSVLEAHITLFRTMIEYAQQGLSADQIDDAGIDDDDRQLGLAIQLAYLGRAGGDGAPDVFDGWTIDRGIAQFQNPALEIRIMLTRNELSTLSRVVGTMIDEMDRGALDPTTFFQQMQGAMALLSQDSARVASRELHVLGDAVGAYLAELPYLSDIMRLTEQEWISLGGGEQQALKNRLKSKLRAYEDIFADPALWTSLDPSAPEGEQVSLIKLDLMP